MIKLALLLLLSVQHVRNDESRKFLCDDGDLIELSAICNGRKDCQDGSDETLKHCLHLVCPPGMFRCSYGACIPKQQQCDGDPHCADKSDEDYCNTTTTFCKSNEFKCQSGDECIAIENLCNHRIDCMDQSDENRELCNDFICPNETYRCNIGGCIQLNERCNGYKDCIDGSDESEKLCRNLNCLQNQCSDEIKCPPIRSTKILTKCISRLDGLIPCDRPLPTGTIVEYECKPFYIPINSKHSQNRRMFCQLDGTWNREILKCKPDCGRISLDINPLIIHGWYTQPANFPWNSILYLLENGKWSFICGGTLIFDNIVITAAHCIWEIDANLLKIGFGKTFSDFYRKEETSQYRDVVRIIKHPLYQDFIGNYGSDIAILILNETVEFSSTILPACIDWESIQAPVTNQNNLGLIAGMGVTETGNYSKRLHATYLSLIDYQECLNEQSNDFKKYVTYTTICAGWMNGTGVCNGDSGGGLMYKTRMNYWILLGIVSVSPRQPNTSLCDPKRYTVFTKIRMYTDWIYDNLNGIIDDLKSLI